MSNPKTTRYSAMIIDSAASTAMKTRRLLDDLKVDVLAWEQSGVGWVAKYQEVKPDFCFIDLVLTKRDGIFCVEKLRSMDPQIQIVFIHPFHGALANRFEAKAMSVGAISVLQRPFSDERFSVTVKKIIQMRSKIAGLQRIRMVPA